MHLAIPGYQLAGAVVSRAYSAGGEKVATGSVLSAEAFGKIGHAVRRIFLREAVLTPFYVATTPAAPPVAATGSRFVIHRGNGRYDVVAGTLLNTDPLTRAEADALVDGN